MKLNILLVYIQYRGSLIYLIKQLIKDKIIIRFRINLEGKYRSLKSLTHIIKIIIMILIS